jgi:hypothetical protein
MVLRKSLLQRVQFGSTSERLDCTDFTALGLYCQHQTTANCGAIDKHRACTADTLLAADVRTGQAKVMA